MAHGRKYAKYQNNYEKKNIRRIIVKVNKKTEPELLEWLSAKENAQGYIKRLVLKDMKETEESGEKHGI